MHENGEIKDFGEIDRQLHLFYENELNSEICNLRTTFRKPIKEWFIKTRDEIQRIRKDDELHYKQTIDIFTKQLTELDRLINQLQQRGWHHLYREAVVKACESLPQEIIEEQGEERFATAESDSMKIKSGKWVKQIGKKFSRNGFSRTVYLRQLVMKFMFDNSKWIEELAAREYDELAMLIDTLLEKTDTHSENESSEEGEKGYTDFKIEIFLELEDHLQVGVQHLKQFEQNNESQVEHYINQLTPALSRQAEIAGTFELAQKNLEESGYSEFNKNDAERLEKQNTAWVHFLRSQFADLNVQTEIARFGFIASSVKDDILAQSHEFFRDSFYVPIENGVKATKLAIESLKELKSASGKGIEKKIEAVRTELSQQLSEELIRPMQKQEKLLQPLQKMQHLLSDLQVESRRFSDEVHLAKKRVSAYPIPEIEMDTLRWQSLAARYLKEEALKKLAPSNQEFDKLLAEMLIEVEEAVQISDVNLLAAVESKETEGEEETPLEIALKGLERAVNTLEKSIKQVREKQNSYQVIVKEKLPTAMHSLARTMLSRDFDRFEMQDKALKVKEQAFDWNQKLSSKWAHVSDRVELGGRFMSRKFKEGSRVVSPYLGFKSNGEISIKEKRNLAEYLAKPGVESDLPFIYKRLFDRDFSIDERFYVAPKNSIELIGSSYDQWKRGLSANVAIIGEKGSGKTTMIRFAKKEVFVDGDPIEINFEKTFTDESELLKRLCSALGFKAVETRDEFLEKVEKKKLPSVLIVENLQNIFIRNINGYEALESFWVIMSSTMDKLFWVVSSSRYSWNFFVKMSNADQYFSHVLYADDLSEADIRDAIMARHKSTGYELYFEPGENMKKSRAYKKLLGDEKQSQELVRDTYFSRLSKISEGNTSIAMIFWLQSIKEFDNRRFVFRPLQITEVDKLEVPAKEVLFTLASLVMHDTLSSAELAKSLHQDLSQSRLMLARLKTKGIVYESKSGYNLNHLVYRQVVRLLKRRNIIH